MSSILRDSAVDSFALLQSPSLSMSLRPQQLRSVSVSLTPDQQKHLAFGVTQLKDIATRYNKLSLNQVVSKFSAHASAAAGSVSGLLPPLSLVAETSWTLDKLSQSLEAESHPEWNNLELKKLVAQSQESFDAVLSGLLARITISSITGDMTQFRMLHGKDLLSRLEPYCAWKDSIREAGLWFFEKTSNSAPVVKCEAVSDIGVPLVGVNFSSQDYLSLSSHTEIKEAAKQAIDNHGVHSAGAPALFGNTKYSAALEQEIASFLGHGMDHIALFPTGWGAGFGAVTTLIRPQDHIVADQLTHSCLREGALSATKNFHLCPHLDNGAMAAKLREIRARDTTNAILVITESLFSMDSDSPNLQELHVICRQHGAWLLVDVAHDLGCLGATGRGMLEVQNMIGKVDFIIGSFSKTFGSNGGFLASRSRALKEYSTFFSAPRAYSNALSPAQTASVQKAFQIIRSEEGTVLRNKLMRNVVYMRQQFTSRNIPFKGLPSAIVPIVVGEEGLTRIVVRLLAEEGVIANIVEYPAVPKKEARLRIQVMADHSLKDVDTLVTEVENALAKGMRLYDMVKTKSHVQLQSRL